MSFLALGGWHLHRPQLSGRREVDERVHRGNVIRCKGYPIIIGGIDVVECVEGRFHMPN